MNSYIFKSEFFYIFILTFTPVTNIYLIVEMIMKEQIEQSEQLSNSQYWLKHLLKERVKQLNSIILDLEQKQTIKKGCMKDFTPTEFVVLLAIQSFTDIQQKSAFPSQQRISDITGVSVMSVRRSLKSLEEKGAITRNRKSVKCVTHYTLSNLGDEPVETSFVPLESEIETIDSKKYNTAQDFLIAFKQMYFATYGIHYVSSERGDISQIKGKLTDNFTDEELDAILTITFRDYTKHWSNRKYPRPVIGGICTFIARQALNKWEEEKKKADRIKEAEAIDLDIYFRNQQI